MGATNGSHTFPLDLFPEHLPQTIPPMDVSSPFCDCIGYSPCSQFASVNCREHKTKQACPTPAEKGGGTSVEGNCPGGEPTSLSAVGRSRRRDQLLPFFFAAQRYHCSLQKKIYDSPPNGAKNRTELPNTHQRCISPLLPFKCVFFISRRTNNA